MACRVIIPDNKQVVDTTKVINEIYSSYHNIIDEEHAAMKTEIEIDASQGINFASTFEMNNNEALSAPITEEIFSEPVNKITDGEPITEEIFSEPVNKITDGEPITEEIFSDPVNKITDGEPITEEIFSEPVNKITGGEPITEEIFSEPVNKITDGEPITEEIFSEPVNKITDGEPITEPITEEIFSEPVNKITDGEPITEEILSEPVNKITDGEPITEEILSEPVNKITDDEPISSTAGLCQNKLCNENVSLSHREMDVPYFTTSDKEFTVSDIYEQATLIGQDIEEVNSRYGSIVSEAIMPKLIFILDKLESFVVQNNDNKSMIKALLLEKEDLTRHKCVAENETEKLKVQLENAEFLLRTDDKRLHKRIKFLKIEKKVLSKEVKKRNKKLKKLRRGEEGSTILWFLDRFLFSGRLFFVTKELPRDIGAIEKLDGVINTQNHEIHRLSSEIEMQEQEKGRVATNINFRSDLNEYLKNQNSIIKTQLSQLEVECEPYIYRKKQKKYKKLPAAGLREGTSTRNEITDVEADDNEPYDYSDAFPRETARASSYWDLLNTIPLDNKELMLQTSVIPHHDEDVTTKMASINTQTFETDACMCELDERQDNNSTTDSYDDNNHKVEVEIHANRKDNKKLLLAQELRDCISATTDENNIEANYNDCYHNYSDGIMNVDGTCTTCYWDDIDSKTSYEDVSSVASSDDTLQNHFYFILDKRNMRAKRVEHAEYQSALQKSISLPKMSKTSDCAEMLASSQSAYNIRTMDDGVQLRKEHALYIL